MATLTSFLFSPSLSFPHLPPFPARASPFPFLLSPLQASAYGKLRLSPVLASSDSSAFDDLRPRPIHPSSGGSSKKSYLSSLIQEIEPLDVSLIQKDVPPTTLDAMKRTISGMLGLLPSDQFQVSIDALWESLSKLLVSSMMTGYTLRNAEYKLCLEKNLDIHEESIETNTPENSNIDMQRILLESTKPVELSGENELSSKFENVTDDLKDIGVHGLGELSSEVQQYILHLQSRLSSVRKELSEVKRKSAALQMQQFVGEEKNDLLDYLRSLRPEKVAELSESTSLELRDTVNSVVYGLLATLSPKMQSKSPPLSDNSSTGTFMNEDWAGLVENTSLPFQPHISLTRDYLARLLFWCMLLGHYVRGLEYRLGLIELLSLTDNVENDGLDGEQLTA